MPQPWHLSSPRSASALPPPSSSAHGTAGHWRPCFPCGFHGREFPLVAISPACPLQASNDFHLPATSKAEPLLPLFGALAAGRAEPHGALISSSLPWTPRKIPQPSPIPPWPPSSLSRAPRNFQQRAPPLRCCQTSLLLPRSLVAQRAPSPTCAASCALQQHAVMPTGGLLFLRNPIVVVVHPGETAALLVRFRIDIIFL
jgi:hypothetical protein